MTLILPARIERHPDAPDTFRLYGEEGSLDPTGRTYRNRADAATARDALNSAPYMTNLFGEHLEPATAPETHLQLGLLEIAPTSTFGPAPTPIHGDTALF